MPREPSDPSSDPADPASDCYKIPCGFHGAPAEDLHKTSEDQKMSSDAVDMAQERSAGRSIGPVMPFIPHDRGSYDLQLPFETAGEAPDDSEIPFDASEIASESPGSIFEGSKIFIGRFQYDSGTSRDAFRTSRDGIRTL